MSFLLLLDNWVLMAFIAVFMWAMVNLLDVYFTQEVFDSPYDGVMVSGIFQGMFCLLPILQLTPFNYNGILPIMIGVLSGICFQLACLFYFKALFARGDVVMMQILWNLNMALVPIISFFFLNHTRSLLQIVGSLIVIFGSTLFSLEGMKKEKVIGRHFYFMLAAVVFFSISKVFESAVYANLSTEFWTGYLYFSLGNLFVSIMVICMRKSQPSLFRRYFNRFCVAEGLSILATLASARAILLSQTASAVVLVEGFTPVVTIILTFLMMLLGSIFGKNHGLFKKSMLDMQVSKLGLKIAATFIMSAGLYLTLI